MPQAPAARPSFPPPRSRPPRVSSAGSVRRAGAARAATGGEARSRDPVPAVLQVRNPQKTYAAQLKRANNGNHFLVLTEGKRDESTGEVRKTRRLRLQRRLRRFFKLLQAAAQFISANPVPTR
jgi:hypothetical protein